MMVVDDDDGQRWVMVMVMGEYKLKQEEACDVLQKEKLPRCFRPFLIIIIQFRKNEDPSEPCNVPD